MRKSYLLLLFFIVNIYTDPPTIPLVCDNSGTTRDCLTADCTGDSDRKFLYNKKCYTEVKNCLEYNPNYNACYKCNTGYELYDDGAVKKCKVEHCKTPGTDANAAKCTTCNPGFTGDGTTSCSCSKIGVGYDGTGNTVEVCDYVDNCVEYDTDGICTKCKVNYQLVDDDAASPRIAGQKKCIQCADSKGSNGGNTCLSNTDTIVDCIEYDAADNGKCSKCGNRKHLKDSSEDDCVTCPQTGYKVVGDYCLPEASLIPNCIEYNDLGKCVKCDEHMKTVGGTSCDPCYSPEIGVGDQCIEPIENCETYDITTKKCTSCKGDNELKYGVCVAKCKDCTQDPNGNDPKGSGNADGSDGSDGNMMRLNIIYMAIMLMIIA